MIRIACGPSKLTLGGPADFEATIIQLLVPLVSKFVRALKNMTFNPRVQPCLPLPTPLNIVKKITRLREPFHYSILRAFKVNVSMASTTRHDSPTFSTPDYVVLCLMLILSAAIGVYYALSGGKQRTAAEFLMGNRNIPLIPVAVSLVASYMSAITYLGAPADVYFNGSMFTWFAVSHVIACFIIGRTFVPVFYSLQLTSVFEVSVSKST